MMADNTLRPEQYYRPLNFFISHSLADRDLAQTIFDYFVKLGLQAVLPESSLDLNDEIKGQLEFEIARSNFFVVIIALTV